MKQELSLGDNKSSNCLNSPAPAARARLSRTRETRDSSRTDSANGVSAGLKTRPRPCPPEANSTHRARRSIQLNKVKPEADDVGVPKERENEETKTMARPGNRIIEQYARFRRRPDTNCGGSEEEAEGKTKELQRRLDDKERLVQELQSEVLALKSQLEKLQGHNVELQSQNKKLGEDLLAAEEKIKVLQKRDQVASVCHEVQPSGFRDVQKLIANKLENMRTKKEIVREDSYSKIQPLALDPRVRAAEPEPNSSTKGPIPPRPTHSAPVNGPPPPPPPPPPCHFPAKANTKQQATALVGLYHSLAKREKKTGSTGNGNPASSGAGNAHNSIIGELQNRSAHLLAIKADVETKGDFIKCLKEKLQSAAFTNMEGVLIFVDWLDRELSTLADERAVLKHFNWPERKADALREAAFEYRYLRRLEAEVSSVEDDPSLPCEATLKKISNLLDKLEQSLHRLVKLRNTTMHSYKECKIPTDWMLDSGMVSKIKLGSIKLAKVYMKRVSMELESVRHSERESAQKKLIFEGVSFAYRAHQFAGGLDSETMRAFEDLRERVQSQGRGSKEQLNGRMLS